MAAYIALFISLVSLILMIVILIRFKKLFSTDAIIDKTKSQMNRVIMDVNNNANRDIELINESSRRLRALLNEADKKMENFQEAMQLLRNTIPEAEKTSHSNGRSYSGLQESQRFADIKPVGQKSKKTTSIDPDATFEITKKAPSHQGSLFDDPEPATILKDETLVTQDGAAYKEVPLIVTKVYDEEPGQGGAEKAKTEAVRQTESYPPKNPPFFAPPPPASNRTLKDKVEKLFNQGMQVDDIAEELSCPASEVQFIIDML